MFVFCNSRLFSDPFFFFNIIIIRSIFHSHSTSTQNTSTKDNETLLAVGTAYVQGEDVAGRGRILLFSVVKNPENSQILVCFWIVLSLLINPCVICSCYYITTPL